MPSTYEYERVLFSIIDRIKSQMSAKPLFLGGITASGGGGGGPSGGFVGYLPQTRVAYDLSEAATAAIPASGESLLDNLNHMRWETELAKSDISVIEADVTTLEGEMDTAQYDIDQLQYGLSQIGAGTITVKEEGVLVASGITTVDFRGGVDVTLTSTTAIVTVSGGDGGPGGAGHTIQDEGVDLAARTYLDFIGDGVTAIDDLAGDKTKVTIPGVSPTFNIYMNKNFF